MPPISLRLLATLIAFPLLSACVQLASRNDEIASVTSPATPPAPTASCPAPESCPVCPVCAGSEPAKPAEKPLQAADWKDLPGWTADNPGAALSAFVASCRSLERQALWSETCKSARGQSDSDPAALRAWFEAQFKPWALTQPDGSRNGMITGYYEPILSGSRVRSNKFAYPVFGAPDDLVTVDLSDVYPELKNLRLRGRLEGKKLVPYYSRTEWTSQETLRAQEALIWFDDPIDVFFMQIQGSGQVRLPDGSRIRLNYADQNGHPYRSIGKWLIDRGELKPEQASMQGIKHWAKGNPKRMAEMLNSNPSIVFFRELAVEGSGPQGALGIALTPERSIAIDPRHITLGAPVWLASTRPNSETPLNRLMIAQDTGGAIRGVVRADFYWGSGTDAGNSAGKMRQQGRMWVLMPKSYAPN